jgi:hypothetical protein
MPKDFEFFLNSMPPEAATSLDYGLGWLTHPDPRQWYTVYNDQYEGFIELRDFGFIMFLVSALKGATPLPDNVMGKQVTKAPRIFVPF